ncbi:MAG: peroxidase, partial [Pirellulaceae bacterium]
LSSWPDETSANRQSETGSGLASESDMKQRQIDRRSTKLRKKRIRRPLASETLEDRLLMTFDFRSIDGTGNNESNGRNDWGATDTQLIRNGYPGGYPDGYGDEIRTAPNPRDVSNAIHAQTESVLNDRNLSDWVVQWGQFITHDLDLTTNDASFDDLFSGGTGDFSIPINDANDPLGPNAIPFHRSNYDPDTGDTDLIPSPPPPPGRPPAPPRPDWREQINSITSFIDASNVYGSDQARADALRTFADGKLKTTSNGLLPDFNTGGFANDDPIGMGTSLFLLGDARGNEQTGLTATHSLFIREHNRLADLLKANDNALTDQEIYQIARKIVGAEMQIITYHEFLPAMLGNTAPSAADYSYNDNVDPTVTNSFASAFFRYGHSMQSPSLALVNNDGSSAGGLSLRGAFFNPNLLTNDTDVVDQVLKGLAVQVAQENDALLVDDIRNFLFGPPGAGGLDLAALDIQRGRDHGLVGFNELRGAYQLQPLQNYSQLTSDATLQQTLQSIYGNNVNNVDPFVAGVVEDHLPGTSVGQMVQRSIADQFTRLRDGDRFFYTGDVDLQESAVTSVIDLDNFSLAELIKANTNITNIQDNVFFAANDFTTPQIENVYLNHGMTDPQPLPTGDAPGSWAAQRSTLGNIVIEFSEQMNVSINDIQLTNLGINAPVDPDEIIALAPNLLEIDGATLTINLMSMDLPDGAYKLELLPTITNTSGIPLDGNGDGTTGDGQTINGTPQNHFYQLTADWSGDEGVSVFDFTMFAYWFGEAIPAAPTYVDLNHDNGISVFDFTGFSDHFGVGIQYQTALSASVALPINVAPSDVAPSDDNSEGQDELLIGLVAEEVLRLQKEMPFFTGTKRKEQVERAIEDLAEDWLHHQLPLLLDV